jgi:hypothetical protein
VASHVIQENWRIQFTNSINHSAKSIVLSIPVAATSMDFAHARKTENIRDTASWVPAIHQQEIAPSNAT